MPPFRHHFTVDVEEHFHASALEPHLPRSTWSGLASRVEKGMTVLLDLMVRTETKGTFFFLGLVAEKNPGLVRRVASAGHEVASHGWDHRRVTDLKPEGFRQQVRDSRNLLQDLSGTEVMGFRAPSFSILPGMEWALDILVEEGYRYDSSLYPVRRPGYGYPGGRRDVHRLELPSGDLIEVPPATVQIGTTVLPAGGGGTFRLLPFWFSRRVFQGEGESGGIGPATFYLHPWELDPEQPRAPGVSLLTRLRHYTGLRRTRPRLERLLAEVDFQPIARTLGFLDSA